MKTTGIETVPLVGQSTVNIDLVLRLAATQASGRLTLTLAVCRLESVTFPDSTALRTTFTPSVLSTFTTTASEDAPPVALGAAIPLPSFTILSGIDPAGNSIDADQDAHDGVTIPTDVGNGWLKADGYVGITIDTSLTTTLTDASTLTGTADFSAVGKIFGSTNPVLTSGNISVTPSSKATPFSATRLPGDVPCSAVVQRLPPG